MDCYNSFRARLFIGHSLLAMPDCRVVPTLPIGWVWILGQFRKELRVLVFCWVTNKE